jgi:hypothetical protein
MSPQKPIQGLDGHGLHGDTLLFTIMKNQGSLFFSELFATVLPVSLYLPIIFITLHRPTFASVFLFE